MTRPAPRTIYLLKRAETTVRLRLEEALRDLGVTPGQYTSMTLVRRSREISSAELARQVGVTPQSMSEMIAALERKGLVARGNTPANRRIMQIGLSPEGQALIASCDERVEAMERDLLGGLTTEQINTLRTALAAIGLNSCKTAVLF